MKAQVKRFLMTYVKLVVFSIVGMLAAHIVVEYGLGMEQYEEYIVAASVALGTVMGLRMDGIRSFSWTLFYLSYEILLVIASIVYGTSNSVSAGTIFVRFLFGSIMMALLLLGLRLYVFKNIAIQIGQLKFGCFDDTPSKLLLDEEKGKEE